MDPFDPNQHRETATPLKIGEQVSGEASAYDEDWFMFEAEAGEQITVDVQVGEDNESAYIYESVFAISVYNPDGELLAGEGIGDPSPRLT